MNKKIIVVISLIMVLVFGGLIFFSISNNLSNEKETKKGDSINESKSEFVNVILSTNTFTLGDNKTEVGIKIENLQDKDVLITEIKVSLYNGDKNIIDTKNQTINLNLKSGESQNVIVTFDEKYADTADFKYEIIK